MSDHHPYYNGLNGEPLPWPPQPPKKKKGPNIFVIIGLVFSALFLLIIAGCAVLFAAVDTASDAVSPPPVVQQTTEGTLPSDDPTPTPEPTQTPSDEVTTTATDDDGELTRAEQKAALELSWDEMSKEDKKNICVYWEVDREGAIEAFQNGAGSDSPFTREVIEEFFDGKC